jgi:inorganic pyrophosphatase
MDLSKISVGPAPPWDVNVVIEIPLGSEPVKYEVDKDSGALYVDRFLHTSMVYPCNYGFVPHTLADDGDPADVLVVSPARLISGAVVRSRPIGLLVMKDEMGADEKILSVPVDDLHPFYRDVTRYDQLPKIVLDQIVHFFAHYKDLEPGKWAEIGAWQDENAAAASIEAAIRNAEQG